MEENQLYTIILRHDTSTNWVINDPILALGEYGVEDDTHRVKRGDGQTKWSELYYETFGIDYELSFENIQGSPYDNTELATALNDKLSESVFEDSNYNIVTSIVVTDETGEIAKIIRSNKDISTSELTQSKVLIRSTDNSIGGIWTIDSEGTKILDLSIKTIINEFKPNTEYKEGQICIYNNEILMAKTDIITGETIDLNDWNKLSTTEAEDLNYDNTDTSLESDNVQDAISELSNNVDDLNTQLEWKDYDE